MDLKVKGIAGSTTHVFLPNTLVYITDAPLSQNYPVLFGQKSGFEDTPHRKVRRYWKLSPGTECPVENAYVEAKEAREIEAAFAGFTTQPTRSYVMQPTPKDQIPLPWYLNPSAEPPPEKGLTD